MYAFYICIVIYPELCIVIYLHCVAIPVNCIYYTIAHNQIIVNILCILWNFTLVSLKYVVSDYTYIQRYTYSIHLKGQTINTLSSFVFLSEWARSTSFFKAAYEVGLLFCLWHIYIICIASTLSKVLMPFELRILWQANLKCM